MTRARRGRQLVTEKDSTPNMDGSRNSESDGLIVDASQIPIEKLSYLNTNHIYWQQFRTKRSFVCQACGVTISTLGGSIHHSNLQSHRANLLTLRVRFVLWHLPPVSPSHRLVLNQTLMSAKDDVLIDPTEALRRHMFADQVMAALRHHINGLQITGVGSLWSGLSLVDSEVDFDVQRLESDVSNSSRYWTTGHRLQTLVSDASFVRSPGLGYLLAETFDVLKANAVDQSTTVTSTPNKIHVMDGGVSAGPPDVCVDSHCIQNGDEPRFPVFHNVMRTDSEHFYISFSDSQGVCYQISTGDPRGHHLAKLVRIYLSLDERALHLAILCRKLSKLAYLDMPLNGTFPSSVLPILVIFYLQHTSPSILPNLHQLYRDHKEELPAEAVEKVFHDSEDHSFLVAPEYIAKYWIPNPAVSNFDLADIWLGFLRFYLIDFQKTKCCVCISWPDPIPCFRSGGGASSVKVIDPFDPQTDMCRRISGSGFEYINSQLLAAYGYFGVPRLINGRHVFTHIQTHDSEAMSQEPACSSTRSSSSTGKKPQVTLHLTPVVDDSDEFAPDLIRVNSLLAEKFTMVADSATSGLPLPADSAENNPVCKTVPLETMVPYMFHIVLDGVLDSADVPVLTECSLRAQKKSLYGFCSPSRSFSWMQYQLLMQRFSKAFWSLVFRSCVDRGVLSTTSAFLQRSLVSTFRRVLIHWLTHDNAVNVPSDVGPKESSDTADLSDMPESTAESVNTTADVVASSSTTTEMNMKDDIDFIDDEDKDIDGLDAVDATFDDPDSMMELPNGYSDTSCAEIDHDQRMLEFDATQEEQFEFAEQTLDLGEDDDPDLDTLGLASPDVVPLLDVADGSCVLQPEERERLIQAVDSLKSSTRKFPESDKLTDCTKETTGASSEALDSATGVLSGSNEQSAAALKKEVPKKQSAEKLGKRATQASRGRAASQNRGGEKSKHLTWSNCIVPREHYAMPVDDNRPNYYNSAVVANLQPEQLSFPFVARGHLPAPGRHGIRSSILGLAAPNQPSTLLAHFTAPEPQCKACGNVGHRREMCVSAVDKSVSFAVWQKMCSKVPHPAPSSQIAALSDCLTELASFHDVKGQEVAKNFIVDVLRWMFSCRFPSVQLELFGSCANGFELPSSDMDLCVFFPQDSPRWLQLKSVEGTLKVIREFKSCLHQYGRSVSIVHIHAILNAKVPILKVRFSSGFEVDISFSNHLALVNTRMLKSYSVIEPRLRVLGIALKVIGKLCHIGNASVGGVSSYALIIMLIHYLQQKDQLPVLQELYEGTEKPVNLVHGWDAWYQDDLAVVSRLWKPCENQMSLGEMWLGFFRYYLFDFDRDMNVVCIRQKRILPRFVKMWNSLFAIEDPFNLDHNLTGSLSRDSLLCILDVFYAVLLHHTTSSPKGVPLNVWQYSLFCPSRLAEKRQHGPPAKSRCFRCQECGHRSTNCPRKDRKDPNADNRPNLTPVDILIGPFLRQNSATPLTSQRPPKMVTSDQARIQATASRLGQTVFVCPNYSRPNFSVQPLNQPPIFPQFCYPNAPVRFREYCRPPTYTFTPVNRFPHPQLMYRFQAANVPYIPGQIERHNAAVSLQNHPHVAVVANPTVLLQPPVASDTRQPYSQSFPPLSPKKPVAVPPIPQVPPGTVDLVPVRSPMKNDGSSQRLSSQSKPPDGSPSFRGATNIDRVRGPDQRRTSTPNVNQRHREPNALHSQPVSQSRRTFYRSNSDSRPRRYPLGNMACRSWGMRYPNTDIELAGRMRNMYTRADKPIRY